jgi:hypothetical protein
MLSAVLIPIVASAFGEETKMVVDSCCCKVGDHCDILSVADCNEIAGTCYAHPPYNCIDWSRCEKQPTVPSLSEWVLIILALSVGGFFVWQLKRRKAVLSLR